jgi:hypothetical protein
MAIQSTDLVAVNRSLTNYKETYGNKANIDKSDYLMVEATTTTGGRVIGNQYRCNRFMWDGGGTGATGPDSSTPVASDLLLIERPSATLNGAATLGDTALTVDAIPAALPSATVLVFDGVTGYAEFTLTSSASAGAITLTGSGGLKGSAVADGVAGGVLYKATKTVWDNFPTLANIYSANYMVTLGTLLYGKPSNNTNPYSVVEVEAEISSSAGVVGGVLYIGFHNTASTTWYGDLPIAGVQILQPNGTIIRNPGSGSYGYCWNFAIAVDRSDWWTTDSSETGESVITSTTATPASDPVTGDPGYYTIPTPTPPTGASSGIRRFTAVSTQGTTSANVGAKRGIPSSIYTGNDSTTSILPVGNANVAQSGTSGTDGYIFSECSGGTSAGAVTWLQSAESLDLYNGDRIRICYFGGGNGPTSSNGLQANGSLYIRFIAD